MTQEDKDLLFRDLCARLPYGVKVTFTGYSGREDCILNSQHLNSTYAIEYLRLKPYLRPMSSMTEEEEKQFQDINMYELPYMVEGLDWLNAHHFDYRGLITYGLALEAPEGMYNN
jgi:hypothetical protein